MPSENIGNISFDIEQLRRNSEELRRLSEEMRRTWTSTVTSYQVEMPEPFHPQEVDNFEIHEIGRDGSVFRSERVREPILKEVKITDIPRKKVKECGVAVFCKQHFK
jgi:hypothetical protein